MPINNHLNPLAIFQSQSGRLTLAELIENQANSMVTAAQTQTGMDVEIESRLILAIGITAAVHQIHQHYPVHGALNPASIILEIDPAKQHDDLLVHIRDSDSAPDLGIEKQLLYASPEQTGRMNRPIDYRTDLYTLGVIFYQLFTGRLPFSTSHHSTLVHAHIAVKPIPPTQIIPTLPIPISDIILKLLAKDPRDRYQSAEGLKADLELCLGDWRAFNRITLFPLGQNDISDRLLLPEKLYGRKHERKQLLCAWADAGQGRPQLLLLTGDSGMGKTSLVNALFDSVAEQGGALLCHRAQMQEEKTPYTAIIGIVEDFVQQLLEKDPVQIGVWRERLAAALAGNLTHLLRHIPLLNALLDAPAEFHIDASDPALLLNLSLHSFLQTIIQGERPLLIFIDDAHRVDAASLKLLHDLTQKPESHLLVIWAFRRNGKIPDSLQAHIDSLPQEQQLALPPLDKAAIAAFLTDAFQTTKTAVADLTPLVHAKTHGNPFFLREFLLSLNDRELIHFDHQRRIWRWDLAQVQAAPLANNVVELVRDRLQLLPVTVQATLKVAAIMGDPFDLDALALARRQTPAQTTRQLQRALTLGAVTLSADTAALLSPWEHIAEPRSATLQQMTARFITPPGDNVNQIQPDDAQIRWQEGANPQALPCLYQFAHEQIRAAARLLLPDMAETAVHWQIGQRLWQNMPPDRQQENLFLIVSHLNYALPHHTGPAQHVMVAQANLQAGRQALALVAYENALSFALRGLEYLGEETSRQENAALRHQLQLIAVQAASRLGRFEQTNYLLDRMAQQATSLLDQVSVTQERMLALYLNGKQEEAVAAALSALRRLGVRLPRQPGKRHIAFALLRTQIALRGKPIESLEALPPMTDEQGLKAMEIMATATLAAASVNANLLMMIGLEITQQTIKNGSHPLSAMGYALYGVLLCGATGQIDRGYAFGQLALRMAAQIRAKEYRVFVKYFVYAHVNHWKEPIRATLQPLRELATTGEFEYLAIAAGLYPYFTWFINGTDLSFHEQSIAENIHLLEPFQDTPLYYRYQMGQQYFQNLLGMAADACQMVGVVYDENRLLPLHLAENDHTTIFYLACHKLTLCYLFENYEEGLLASQLAERHRNGGIGTPLLPVLCFYNSLSCLALYPEKSGAAGRKLLKTVHRNQRKMGHWANHGPANCRHRYTLVEAERARVLGREREARDLYDAAIKQAQTADYLPELALAHELAAKFYLGRGPAAYAEHHLRRAHHNYQTWGALAKRQQLEERFPHLFPDVAVEKADRFAGLSTYLDMNSVLKATQILSAETSLPHLLETLTAILMENAGAQYGHLLLPEEEQWRVVISREKEGDESEPGRTAVAMSILRQVAQSHEPLLLNDVGTAMPHPQDPHLREARPRSILCLPLLDKGELIGIFYMENRLTRHAFHPERLPTLTALAAQAAISIKNAGLVAELKAAQENILVSERRFRLLFDNAPLSIFEIDISAAIPQIRTANKRAEAIYGWSAAEIVTLDSALLMPDESRQEIQRLIETVRAGKTAVIESTNRRRDGAVFPVRIIATPAHTENSRRMIVAVEDITMQQQRRSEVEAIEEERRRIAREIHDGIAQDLAFLRLKLALWRDWIHSDPDQMQQELAHTEELLDASIQEMRRSIYALRPLALDELGLLPTLRRYVADFSEQHGVYVTLQLDVPEEKLPDDLELPLFRAIQEGLSNIARHAQATLAWVDLRVEAGEVVELSVRDNGRGFEAANLSSPGRSQRLGLMQMRERIEKAGGQLTISSQPGQGTKIQIKLQW